MILNILVQSIILVILYFSFIYILSRLETRVDIVDTSFGIGFIVLSIYFFVHNILLNPGLMRKIIVTTLVIIWGMRLSYHVYGRSKDSPDNSRYQNIILKWSNHIELKKYFYIFLPQGLIILFILSSVIFIDYKSTTSLGILDLVGILIWIFGFLFESISDSQLTKFISYNDNKDKIMSEGLWQYTRHPNYFGEIVQWFGIFIIALSIRYGYIFMISPIAIYILLVYISGIPIIEKNYEDRLGWEDYKKKTSKLFPLPSKKSNEY